MISDMELEALIADGMSEIVVRVASYDLGGAGKGTVPTSWQALIRYSDATRAWPCTVSASLPDAVRKTVAKALETALARKQRTEPVPSPEPRRRRRRAGV